MRTDILSDSGPPEVSIPVAGVILPGDLRAIDGSRGLIVFAHGGGSSRRSPRNRWVATRLEELGFATLLFDLFTADEERLDAMTAHFRFDISLLAQRLAEATAWARSHPRLAGLHVGYFGASTGAAAALVAAARHPEVVRAVVSRGGRPDLAGSCLREVHAPTRLIVGGLDGQVLNVNRSALAMMDVPEKDLVIVPGAGHLFEERGALSRVAELAGEWFVRHVGAAVAVAGSPA